MGNHMKTFHKVILMLTRRTNIAKKLPSIFLLITEPHCAFFAARATTVVLLLELTGGATGDNIVAQVTSKMVAFMLLV